MMLVLGALKTIRRPVGPHVGPAVSAERADHAGPELPDDRFVRQVVGVHLGLVVAIDRAAIDEQIAVAMGLGSCRRWLGWRTAGL
jgi:hypothetical protein